MVHELVLKAPSSMIKVDLYAKEGRIDTLRLDLEDNSHNDVTNEFDKLLSELSSKYQMWPLSKKEFATSIVTKLLTESDTFFMHVIRRLKGRPPKEKKKKRNKFELVESSQIHNHLSSTFAFQMNNEMSENDLFDLNAYPTF
uniref:Uncharacterized protein n=1 Tax=Lactuca sativa TaxID=4236 RepID=A0A9R1X6C0_LACSA|nr:hypothetical protein LSAT_V11C600311630 [Lactuca sativa]